MPIFCNNYTIIDALASLIDSRIKILSYFQNHLKVPSVSDLASLSKIPLHPPSTPKSSCPVSWLPLNTPRRLRRPRPRGLLK